MPRRFGLGHPRRYRRGATILLQGHRSETVLILLAGRVKVLLGTADGDEIVLSVLGAGDLLGEFEAIEGHGDGREASNVALEPVECRLLTAAEFLDFLDSHGRATRLLAARDHPEAQGCLVGGGSTPPRSTPPIAWLATSWS